MLSLNRMPLYAAAAVAAVAFLSTSATAQDTYTPAATTDAAAATASPTSEVTAAPTVEATEGDVGLFPVGTRTYGHFDDCDCWVKGRVDEYISGDPSLYRVKWSSKSKGTTDYYDADLDHLLTVVNHAADFVANIGENPDDEKPQIYARGTPVYYNFDDSKWYHGTITGFENDAYDVTWADGTTGTYSLRRIRVMVDQAITQVIRSTGGEAHTVKVEIGMPVRDRYKGKWYDGTITEVHHSDGRYKVTWTDQSTDTYTDKKILKQIIDQGMLYKVGKDDETVQVFPVGTLVYKKFTKKFWKGKITDYKDGTYEVTYSDKSREKYRNLNDVLEMVNQAADLVISGGYKSEGEYPQVYPVGTQTYYHYENGWYNGHISKFREGKYTITWSDFSVGTPEKGLTRVKQMVTQAAQEAMGFKPDLVEKYDIGTPVYYKFGDDWYKGKITAFQAGWYTITWDDDGSTDTYDDLGVMKQMVDAAANLAVTSIEAQEYPIGTPVYNGEFTGKVTGFDDGKYEVTFADGTVHHFHDAKHMHSLVEAANQKARAENPMAVGNSAATAVIVISVLVLSAGIVLVVIRRKRARKSKDLPPPPPPQNPYHDRPEPNIADLKATSNDIV